MKVYQCDSCKEIISNPYAVKMKEFYVEIQICDDCYKGLHLIAEKKERDID